jgi:phosphopantetheinyl transferase
MESSIVQTLPERLASALVLVDEPIVAVAWSRTDNTAAMLRKLLTPLGWDGELDHGPLGRPGGPWFRKRDWTVSLTHTDGLAACAISVKGVVGVDAEALDAAVEMPAVAAMQFDAAAAKRIAEAEGAVRLDRFFRTWALKEAAVKALGVGFAIPVELAITLDPARISGAEPVGRQWTAFEIDCGPDHRMAAALLATPGATPLLITGEIG